MVSHRHHTSKNICRAVCQKCYDAFATNLVHGVPYCRDHAIEACGNCGVGYKVRMKQLDDNRERCPTCRAGDIVDDECTECGVQLVADAEAVHDG